MEQITKRTNINKEAMTSILLALNSSEDPVEVESFPISMRITPTVLNLKNDEVEITVYTDFEYNKVDTTNVWLSAHLITLSSADANGNFVGKFIVKDTRSLAVQQDNLNTIRLEGYTVEGNLFWGEHPIKIIDVEPLK